MKTYRDLKNAISLMTSEDQDQDVLPWSAFSGEALEGVILSRASGIKETIFDNTKGEIHPNQMVLVVDLNFSNQMGTMVNKEKKIIKVETPQKTTEKKTWEGSNYPTKLLAQRVID